MRSRYRVEAIPGYEEPVGETLTEFEEVLLVARERGNHDLSVVVEADDPAHLERFRADKLGRVPGIRGCDRAEHGPPEPPRVVRK